MLISGTRRAFAPLRYSLLRSGINMAGVLRSSPNPLPEGEGFISWAQGLLDTTSRVHPAYHFEPLRRSRVGPHRIPNGNLAYIVVATVLFKYAVPFGRAVRCQTVSNLPPILRMDSRKAQRASN